MIDPALFSKWFESDAARLALYARLFCNDGAADAVQDAFVSLLQEPREPANVKAWLYRAVRNAAVSTVRSDRARARRHQLLATCSPTWFAPRADDPLDAAAAQRCLEALPLARREVVVLRIWAEMTFPEIAQLTGLPVSTTFDHYREGLATMRKKMEPTCPPNPNTL